MSDVLIKGAEMPIGCIRCPCCDDSYNFCRAAKEFIPMLGKPKFCPLVEIPLGDDETLEQALHEAVMRKREKAEKGRIKNMTFEELKAEAKAQGYNLMPIKRKEKLLPCTCGCKRREHWSKWDMTEYRMYEGLRCMRCGKEVRAVGEDAVRRAWNKMIIEEQKEAVRCEDCAHNKMCGQVMEIFGKQYHVNWCSYGERRKN